VLILWIFAVFLSVTYTTLWQWMYWIFGAGLFFGDDTCSYNSVPRFVQISRNAHVELCTCIVTQNYCDNGCTGSLEAHYSYLAVHFITFVSFVSSVDSASRAKMAQPLSSPPIEKNWPVRLCRAVQFNCPVVRE